MARYCGRCINSLGKNLLTAWRVYYHIGPPGKSRAYNQAGSARGNLSTMMTTAPMIQTRFAFGRFARAPHLPPLAEVVIYFFGVFRLTSAARRVSLEMLHLQNEISFCKITGLELHCSSARHAGARARRAIGCRRNRLCAGKPQSCSPGKVVWPRRRRLLPLPASEFTFRFIALIEPADFARRGCCGQTPEVGAGAPIDCARDRFRCNTVRPMGQGRRAGDRRRKFEPRAGCGSRRRRQRAD